VAVREVRRFELLPRLKRLLVERLPTVAGHLLLRVDHAVAAHADSHHVAGLHRRIEGLLWSLK